jgi:hypothetical protein
MNETISYGKYVIKGSIICILCVFLLIVYTSSFRDQIGDPAYYKDVCNITNITQYNVKFNCLSDVGLVTIVELPCVLIMVNTENFTNVRFYRNIQEKQFVLKNNLNVS